MDVFEVQESEYELILTPKCFVIALSKRAASGCPRLYIKVSRHTNHMNRFKFTLPRKEQPIKSVSLTQFEELLTFVDVSNLIRNCPYLTHTTIVFSEYDCHQSNIHRTDKFTI